ncbi:MAG: GTPase Era, partial [Thermoanaerobaculia bacterium]
VALVGRPNAGKSTLLNRFLAEKVAIVSDKAQTTRQRIIGILTEPRGQLVFLDTPGLHRPLHELNRQMLRAAEEAMVEADVVCLVVDAGEPFGAGDAWTVERLRSVSRPRLLALNKIDAVDKPRLLPLLERYGATELFADLVPLSARTGDGCDRLLARLWEFLPEGEPLYDAELVTLHSLRFLAAERIREKVLHLTRDELPHTTAVRLDAWEEEPGRDLVRLHATILVEKASQKKIVVGRQGAMVREIGRAARLDLEDLLGRRVYLELFVRLEPGWREDARVLAELERDLIALR